MVGAFILGRETAGTVHESAQPLSGTAPAATASALQGPSSLGATSSSPGPAVTASPQPYRGPLAPLTIDRASASCTAPSAGVAHKHRVSYAAGNVLDTNPRTVWRCNARVVGQQLVLTLPRRSEVVLVGLVPGYATTSPGSGRNRYVQDNPITRVSWTFDDGTQVLQTLSVDEQNGSLRGMRIVPVITRTVTLKILAVAKGTQSATMISTVRVGVSALGSN